MSRAMEIVQQWHDAVNARDIDAAVALCHPDVAVGGPRGTGEGHDVMRAWLTRSGIRLELQGPLIETGPGRIVAHELAQWRTPADAPADAPAEVPTQAPAPTWVVFEVRDDQLTSVRRFETAEAVPAP